MVWRAGRFYDVHGQKIRYLAVGLFNSAWTYGLFVLLLTLLDGPIGSFSSSTTAPLALVGRHYYLVVQWLNWVLSIPPNTLLMRFLVFRSKGRWHHQVARAYLVYLPAQALSAVLLVVMVGIVNLGPILGQCIAAVIALTVTYLGHKYFTFGARPGSSGNPTIL